ncbi:transporter substrate-binding domain-containing protein [Cupriavidus sp. UME77]|uniref:transporter substrate-binding domain-containing protein n=1 Tax=Cupriavidus TaxID=106589 RepID=UPI00160422AF|nr:transporter substrate-binding domain-containing protein [Cupriavidus sp. UME77]MBB1632151.1 LacI family transcriptional regulator [Cupriavidus sp. UME77]
MTIQRLLRQIAAPVLTLLVLASASAGVQAQTVAEIVKRGKVTIGVVTGAPPFGTTDATGKPAGYDVDVANLLGKYLGVPVDIVPLTSPSRIPALEAGKVDFLVATLAPTPERARAIMFSSPYSAFELTIFAPVAAKYAKLAELGKKKVGVTRGTTQDTALTRLAVPGMSIVRFEDDATCAQALISNQVEAIALPSTTGNEIMKARGAGKFDAKFAFSVQPNSMAVRKDAFELRQWLNTTISYVKLNGELDAIAQKWTGKALPALQTF